MKINVLVGSFAVVLSCSAVAQSQFVGAYGQLSTGYENNTVSSAQLTGTDYGSAPNKTNTLTTTSTSAPLVLGLGYTFNLKNNFTLGLGVDYSALTQDTQSAGFYYFGDSRNTYDYKFSISNRFNAFIAPGYAIAQDKLFYAKLGYSTQSVQYSQTNCCSSPSNKAQVNGYLIGLGYKQFITKALYGFAEANYYAFGRPNLSSSYSDGPGGTVSSNPNVNAYNFLFGLGYRF
ncbi:MAG: outer membrane beta-barrel protein [Burkholderiales bacterium]|nr:outer membrane beta-barrel protein [Burkholderiales bacterium]